ncbi:YihY family inner membrane protein [Thermosporothrix hazakensis]|jgi:YihY family inner membrane protein|uniref:YihY family inner membrane protein n=1 Tax=Thermosporothrix hazakensis TaxID=644383 RepID=A0A326U7I3_THEHA|nr:YihY/virulence factor BrkB family protein [Thermosporothrix hazakensis]PZW30667.1 YihY family inner membrane protein [Thermosporothrix hazakensis]GCE49529.1 hypothetical protein KTH_43980 [Thermosporothrix hazakensis]
MQNDGIQKREHKQADAKIVKQTEKKTHVIQEFITKFNNDWSMNLAGLLAYNLLMSMVPIAIALLAILGFTLGSFTNPADMLKPIETIFPGLAGNQNAMTIAFQQVEHLRKSAWTIAIIAVILAIWSGSRLFVTIEGCLNIIYRLRPRPFLQQNLVSIAMLLLFIVLVPIMIIAASAPTLILGLVGSNPALQMVPFLGAVVHNPLISYLSSVLGGILVGCILFGAIYTIMPNQKISFRTSWCGTLVAAVALELFLLLFPLYIQHSMGSYTGQVGFAVILLLFFYYFAIILIVGAEVNAFFFEKLRPLPNDVVTFISAMGGMLHLNTTQREPHYVDSTPTEQAHTASVAQQPNKAEHQPEQRKQKPSRKTAINPTLLEVIMGTALAFLLQWLNLRREQKKKPAR